ncbi:MAG: zinc ribbon domain-containing protein [Planctomycetota bacterium]
MIEIPPSPWSRRTEFTRRSADYPDPPPAIKRMPESQLPATALTITVGVLIISLLVMSTGGLVKGLEVVAAIGIATFVFAFAGLLVAAPFAVFATNRALRSVIRRRAKVCPLCAYDLRGRPPESARCPECGEIVPTRDAVLVWCRFARSRRKP